MIQSITRDVRLVLLVIGSIFTAGLFSFFVLPRMEDPVLTERAAIVATRVPGASARRVESLVTELVVKKLREFDEVKEVRSISRSNVSTVVVSLSDSINEVDEVWARIRDKISDLRSSLPVDSQAPELNIIRVRAFAAILGLSWQGKSPPVYSVLSRTAQELEDILRSLPNTEEVELFGKPEEEIVLEVRQSELAKMGLTVDDLAREVAASDSKLPAGSVRSRKEETILEIGGELDSLTRINSIPIHSKTSGQSSYVADIADVRKGIAEPARSEALVDGLPAIMIAASVLPDARIDYWNSALQEAVRDFQVHLPPDLSMTVLFAQTPYVESRINYLLRDLIFSALAVFVVVFGMMGWRSACVVGLALPLSSCIVLACLRWMSIPLHQMSLSGLVIALGMLEGTAIIIVDEIQRRIYEGEDRFDAVRHGVSHMALPLFGSCATTVLSFLPIAIMPGSSGEFVGSIGTSVILALVGSLLLSFSIIPALTALTSPPVPDPDRFWNRGYSWNWLSRIYARSINAALEHPWTTAGIGLGMAIPGFLVLLVLPLQFFPSADRDQLHVEIELTPQASLAETKSIALQVRQILLQDPEIARVDWVVGRNAPSFYYNMIGTRQDSANFAEALVQVRSSKNLANLVTRLQEQLNSSVTSAQVRLLLLEQGPPYNAPIELRILGNQADAIRAYGEKVRQLLQRHPDVIQTQADLTDALPKLVYEINEAESRSVRMPLAAIARQLQSTIEGSPSGTVLEGNVEIPVRVRLAADRRSDLSSIETVDLLSEDSSKARYPINLSALGTPTLKAESAVIARFNGQRMNEVRAYLRAGVLPSVVLSSIERDLQTPEFQPPDGCSIELGGESSKRMEALDQLLANIGILVAGIVFVLVFSLKSFRAMFVILAIGVLSFGMAILSLYGTGFAFGFTAIVGAMGMIGIAINDSIVVLAELRSDPRCLKGDRDAILQMVMRSTRHVLCTTFTVGCSFIPMLLEGGTFWPPMAMVIVGGVFGATWLALYWIPAVHILLVAPTPRPQTIG